MRHDSLNCLHGILPPHSSSSPHGFKLLALSQLSLFYFVLTCRIHPAGRDLIGHLFNACLLSILIFYYLIPINSISK